jgi:hypothetical protein
MNLIGLESIPYGCRVCCCFRKLGELLNILNGKFILVDGFINVN